MATYNEELLEKFKDVVITGFDSAKASRTARDNIYSIPFTFTGGPAGTEWTKIFKKEFSKTFPKLSEPDIRGNQIVLYVPIDNLQEQFDKFKIVVADTNKNYRILLNQNIEKDKAAQLQQEQENQKMQEALKRLKID